MKRTRKSCCKEERDRGKKKTRQKWLKSLKEWSKKKEFKAEDLLTAAVMVVLNW